MSAASLKVLNRQEAYNYLEITHPETALYQRINKILAFYQSGIHEAGDYKINATLGTLLGGIGGVKFQKMLEAMQGEATPYAKKIIHKYFLSLFKKEFSNEEENLKAVQEFQSKLDKIEPNQKEAFEKYASNIESTLEAALKNTSTTITNAILEGLSQELDKIYQFEALYKQLEKMPPPSTTNFNNTIQGSVTHQGSGIQSLGQMTIQGNVSTGNTTVQGHQYNNSAGTKVGVQGDGANIQTMNL